jgi:hypothetical protein
MRWLNVVLGRRFITGIALLFVLSASNTIDGKAPNNALPKEILTALERLFPAWRIMELGDLSEDDRSLWKSAHGDAAPGYCAGHFISQAQGQLEYACLLVRKEPAKENAYILLVLTHPKCYDCDGGVSLVVQVLESCFGASNIPVIWMSTRKTIVECETSHRFKASGDVLVIEHLEASSAAFFWKNNQWVCIPTSE